MEKEHLPDMTGLFYQAHGKTVNFYIVHLRYLQLLKSPIWKKSLPQKIRKMNLMTEHLTLIQKKRIRKFWKRSKNYQISNQRNHTNQKITQAFRKLSAQEVQILILIFLSIMTHLIYRRSNLQMRIPKQIKSRKLLPLETKYRKVMFGLVQCEKLKLLFKLN